MIDRDRRHLLAALGTGAALAAVTPAWAVAAPPSHHRRLWPDLPPGGGGPSGSRIVSDKGAVTNIAVPTLEVYAPARPNGSVVLVAPGAGYKRLEIEMEARPAAQWLAARGIAAYILYYRLLGEGWQAGPFAPLQDAQRAIRLIRAGTRGPVGLLGFSAGGHLLGMAAARTAFQSYSPFDAFDRVPARVDQAALIYPIVTIEPPFDHTSTRVQLVGRHPTHAESADWSVQTHIRDHCPPLFLVQAQDDPISNIANTAMLADACRSAAIPVERHVLTSGGHGFGMGHAGSPSAAWPTWYASWLHAKHFT